MTGKEFKDFVNKHCSDDSAIWIDVDNGDGSHIIRKATSVGVSFPFQSISINARPEMKNKETD